MPKIPAIAALEERVKIGRGDPGGNCRFGQKTIGAK